jgi:hypothetical protein
MCILFLLYSVYFQFFTAGLQTGTFRRQGREEYLYLYIPNWKLYKFPNNQILYYNVNHWFTTLSIHIQQKRECCKQNVDWKKSKRLYVLWFHLFKVQKWEKVIYNELEFMFSGIMIRKGQEGDSVLFLN